MYASFSVTGVLIILMVALNSCESAGAENVNTERFPQIYRITCLNNTVGCACISPESWNSKVMRFHHNESVHRAGDDVSMEISSFAHNLNQDDLQRIREASESGKSQNITMTPVRHYRGKEICLYPASRLREYKYHPVSETRFSIKNHSPLDLRLLVPGFDPGKNNKKYLGKFWPTYYHMALEEHYPGPEVPVLDINGKEIAKASSEFLKQVRWEGSGFRTNGERIRWAGKENAYAFYTDAVWGYGAGHGYHVYPYRTIAVNFPGFCRRMFPDNKNCGKADVIGTLVYIEDVALKKIRMEDGKVHDGYFCASDTGSPDFIKDDRIDIFTGVHGGGNPYLPAERQFNLLLAGGIENLVPSDWKLWTAENTRVWCDFSRLPADPKIPGKDDCTHDYHVQADHKALKLYVFTDSSGKYIKCEPAPLKPAVPEKSNPHSPAANQVERP